MHTCQYPDAAAHVAVRKIADGHNRHTTRCRDTDAKKTECGPPELPSGSSTYRKRKAWFQSSSIALDPIQTRPTTRFSIDHYAHIRNVSHVDTGHRRVLFPNRTLTTMWRVTLKPKLRVVRIHTDTPLSQTVTTLKRSSRKSDHRQERRPLKDQLLNLQHTADRPVRHCWNILSQSKTCTGRAARRPWQSPPYQERRPGTHPMRCTKAVLSTRCPRQQPSRKEPQRASTG
jgi:hypothetical protein